MSDDIGAFVPGPRMRIEGRAGGPLAGLTFAAKDLFDVAGVPTGGGNHDWPTGRPIPTRAFVGGADAARRRRDADRQDHHRRGLARHPGRERLRRHADERPRARPRAGRLVVGLGGRGRRGPLRHRARHRHRRLGARAGELLRPLRHPPDARPDRHSPACCPRRRPPTPPAGSRAMPRPSPRSRRSCWASRSRTRCRPAWSIAVDTFGFADADVAEALHPMVNRLAAADRPLPRGHHGAAGPVDVGARATQRCSRSRPTTPSSRGSTSAIRASPSRSRATWCWAR